MNKLSKAQLKLLRKIVATNGGGIYVFFGSRTLTILEERGLIQGKSGGDGKAVHTREGLELIRQIDAKEAK